MSNKLKRKLAACQDEVREAYLNGATLREISEVHNVSSGTIRNCLIELGIDLRPRGRRKKRDAGVSRVLPIENLNAGENTEVTS